MAGGGGVSKNIALPVPLLKVHFYGCHVRNSLVPPMAVFIEYYRGTCSSILGALIAKPSSIHFNIYLNPIQLVSP